MGRQQEDDQRDEAACRYEKTHASDGTPVVFATGFRTVKDRESGAADKARYPVSVARRRDEREPDEIEQLFSDLWQVFPFSRGRAGYRPQVDCYRTEDPPELTVVVMLADNVVERSLRPAVESFRRQEHGARIILSRVDEPEHLRHLGVPELDGDGRVVRIVEKPKDPPSPYAVTGIYFYDATVFEVIPTLRPSGRGELEITDVNNHYVELGQMEYDVLEGFWGDAGESIDAYYEVNDLVRAHGANRA